MVINFELIAQVSSTITLVFGIIAIYFTMKAARGLLAGELRGLINLSKVFLILVMIGVSGMVVYHFNENEIAENVWYLFIFISMAFSLFESHKLMQFGKTLRINLKKRRKK
jgi:cytochrome bd-type quinol oxidase subunit 2